MDKKAEKVNVSFSSLFDSPSTSLAMRRFKGKEIKGSPSSSSSSSHRRLLYFLRACLRSLILWLDSCWSARSLVFSLLSSFGLASAEAIFSLPCLN